MMSDISSEYEMTTPRLVITTCIHVCVHKTIKHIFLGKKQTNKTKDQSLRGWRSEGVGIGHASWSLLIKYLHTIRAHIEYNMIYKSKRWFL